jgi:hypothetical protein
VYEIGSVDNFRFVIWAVNRLDEKKIKRIHIAEEKRILRMLKTTENCSKRRQLVKEDSLNLFIILILINL